MSTIPVQDLIIDNDTDIGLTSDLINGTYKSSSLTDLSNNVYSKITDLSSNVYTQLSNKQPTLTASTNLLGNGSSITSINYINISNKPTNFQSDWNSTIINKPDLNSYLLTSTANSTYATISNLNTKQNIISVTTPLIKNDISNNISIDLSAYPLKSYVDGSLNTINTNKQNKFTCITPLIKNDISNNISIDLSGYLLTSTATSTYATISNLNTKQNIISVTTPLIKNDISNNISIDLSGYATISNLNTKQNTLTFSSPLVNTSNTVTIDLSAYPLKSYVDGSLNTINTNKQNKFTCITPLIKNDISNNISIDLSAYPLKSYVDGSLNTINSSKQNNLTFSNPFSNTSNTIALKYNSAQFNIDSSGNLSLISSMSSKWTTSGTSIYYNTGNVGIGTTSINTKLDISGVVNIHNGTRYAALNYNLNPGSLIIGSTGLNYGGGTNWNGGNAAALMMECDNNTEIVVHDNGNRLASLMYYEGGATNRLTIGRNMGWDTLSSVVMNGASTVNGNFNSTGEISSGATSYSYFGGLRINGTDTGNTLYNGTNQLGITALNNIIFNTGANLAVYKQRMKIDINGNVGIGTETPKTLVHIKGTSPALTIMGAGGSGATTQLNLSTYDHTTNAPNCSLIATDTGTFGATFQIKQKTTGADTNAQFTSFFIDAAGNVNIGTTGQNYKLYVNGTTYLNGASTVNGTLNAITGFTVNSVNINNWLFNNNGILHEAINNFNNIGKFGYTFIHGLGSAPLNGPATGDTQYYSWYIGLGSEYPAMFGTAGSYGMQFAIGRSETNPKLCIRRNQNNSWTSWEGLTAEKAVSLTSGDKTISGNLTVNNITLSSTGKINCVDDYHYIQLNQTTDTLTLQEYGTISFNIGPTKTQKAYINSSGLTVSGISRLNRIVTYNDTFPDLTAVNNATTHSIINIFPGINGQQGALTTDAYNIYLSSFAYGTWMSGPQPYITVNCTMVYNGSNTKLTLQAYGGATGAGYNSKIILNGGGTSGGNISFINDNVTTCTMNSSGLTLSGRTGIQNTNPQSMLHLGNCEVLGSAPIILFGKNNGPGVRNAFLGYSESFYFLIGDYGGTNSGSNTLTQQFAMHWGSPALSILVDAAGYVRMQYGYGQYSDERVKTNIKTIENALDKTLLLRGVEYNDFRIEPERKRIGLIAQEVELIVPEVVRTNEEDGMKSIEYQNLVGLLVEAIKDQQKQINELKNILKNNNLY